MAYLDTFNSRQLRNILGTFTTGVTVITTRDKEGKRHGVTANSFSSVSLEPPLVLWSQALTSKSLPAYTEADHFAVNILADDQIGLSNHFAKAAEDKFASIPYTEGLGGVPVLEGTVAHFECRKVAAYPAGDHVIYIGQVERVSHSGRRPLAFAHGRYMVPYAHELGPMMLEVSKAAVATTDAVRIATNLLAQIQSTIGPHTLSVAVWGNHGPTVIRWQPGEDAIAELRTGQVMSVTRTAIGRAFAAFLPSEVTKPFIDEDLRLLRIADEDEVEQRQHFEDEIAMARNLGLAAVFALDPNQINRVTINAYSAPVYDRGGNMVMALSLAAPAKVAHSGFPQLVIAAGRQLTAEIATEER